MQNALVLTVNDKMLGVFEWFGDYKEGLHEHQIDFIPKKGRYELIQKFLDLHATMNDVYNPPTIGINGVTTINARIKLINLDVVMIVVHNDDFDRFSKMFRPAVTQQEKIMAEAFEMGKED